MSGHRVLQFGLGLILGLEILFLVLVKFGGWRVDEVIKVVENSGGGFESQQLLKKYDAELDLAMAELSRFSLEFSKGRMEILNGNFSQAEKAEKLELISKIYSEEKYLELENKVREIRKIRDKLRVKICQIGCLGSS